MATYAAKLRTLYPFRPPSASVDHLVIGGGVVGLSVAAGLVNSCGRDRTTFLVERNSQLGQETTARNSEVIHSGIYYPIGSLKSRLCVQSRQMMYDRCEALGIPYRKTQKLIVATANNQVPYLDKLSTHSQHPSFRLRDEPENSYDPNSKIPAYFLSGDEARDMEPDLSSDVKAALLVTETGIVDSQALVDSLAREIEEADYLPSKDGAQHAVGSRGLRPEDRRGDGVLVLGTRIVRIDREEKGTGWIVQMETGWEGREEGEKGEVESVRCEVVVNAAGLGATMLQEGVVPENERIKMYPVKGNYVAYKGPGVSNVSRLIYPCPGAGLDHLGTHLTLDLDGNVRFGPDVETIGLPDQALYEPEFWRSHLSASDSPDHIAKMAESVQTYLPGIDPANLTPDYAGIRPNIAPPGSPFSDFMIRHVPSRKGLVELLGFASPGLTSSLATGEYVAAMVRRDVRGEGSKMDAERMSEGWDQ